MELIGYCLFWLEEWNLSYLCGRVCALIKVGLIFVVIDYLLHIYQGYVMNLQPSEAEAGFDIRIPPNANPELLEKRIAEEWAPGSRNMSFEVGNSSGIT